MGGFRRKSGKTPIAVVLKLSPSVCSFLHLQCLAGPRYSTVAASGAAVGAQRSAMRTKGEASNAHADVRSVLAACMLPAPNFWAFGQKLGTSRIHGHKIATDAHMRSNSGVRQVCAAIARRGVRPSFRSVRPGYVRVRIARREGQLGPLGWGGDG